MRGLFATSLFTLALLGTTAAMANQRITFDYFPRGMLANAVIKAWKTDSRYADYVAAHSMVPDFAMAQYDINSDGRPEVFARHTDDLSGFCDTEEVGQDMCLMVIYANTERGLIKIAELPLADEVVVGTRANKGVRDLFITQADGTRKAYIWNGQAYEGQ